MALLIGITSENLLPDEAWLIMAALDAGLDWVHLRKPRATLRQLTDLLDALPCQYQERLVLHDCHELAQHYPVRGIHLNSRSSAVPEPFRGTLSRSCHSIAEIAEYKAVHDYLFLSPIFDSISKQGYHAAFTSAQLREAADGGIIDRTVMALGGISPENIAETLQYGFGGAAVLGYLWKEPEAKAVRLAVKKIRLNMQD